MGIVWYFVYWNECVSDCCSMPTQLYHGENKLIFKEMMMKSALYLETNMLSWIFFIKLYNNKYQFYSL